MDRAQWTRLWLVKIQEYLLAPALNIELLLRNAKGPTGATQWDREHTSIVAEIASRFS